MDRLLLTVSQAAEVLSLGRSKVYEMAAAGELPVVRMGRSVRVPAEALSAWIKDHTVSGMEAL